MEYKWANMRIETSPAECECVCISEDCICVCCLTFFFFKVEFLDRKVILNLKVTWVNILQVKLSSSDKILPIHDIIVFKRWPIPGHVVWGAGRVVPRGHAGVNAVGALQAQGVVGLLPGCRGLVVQDGVVNKGRGCGHDGTEGWRRRWGRGQELGLRAVERLPLTLSLDRCPLFELGQTAALFFDHLLTWREKRGRLEQVGVLISESPARDHCS